MEGNIFIIVSIVIIWFCYKLHQERVEKDTQHENERIRRQYLERELERRDRNDS